MFDLQDDARRLLHELDRAVMSNSVYDTAWVARVPGANGSAEPAFPDALDWLRRNQYPNGSWGAKIEYYHDHIISTLAALIALAERGDRARDAGAIRRGEDFIKRNIRFLHHDPFETVGFEMVLPILLARARQLELDLPYGVYDKYRRIRERKLEMIPRQLICSRHVETAHFFEFMGSELDDDQLADVQEKNGSIGNSPSATAFFLLEYRDNPAARAYLARAIELGNGAVMPAYPVEIFFKSWVLYNFELAGLLDELKEEAQEHLDSLYRAWDQQQGVGFSQEYSVPDLDDTAVVFKVLRRAGYDVDPSVFTAYERSSRFVCYSYERGPSTGAHIHLLDALHTCPDNALRRRMMDKALRFYRTQLHGADWFDKWHVSPYYIIAHATIATAGYNNNLAHEMVKCIVDSQHHDGSWGYFGPTVEETAYCLQALITYHKKAKRVDQAVLYHAAQYLDGQYLSQYHPALWVGKSLYTPQHVVRSAIIGALRMYETL